MTNQNKPTQLQKNIKPVLIGCIILAIFFSIFMTTTILSNSIHDNTQTINQLNKKIHSLEATQNQNNIVKNNIYEDYYLYGFLNGESQTYKLTAVSIEDIDNFINIKTGRGSTIKIDKKNNKAFIYDKEMILYSIIDNPSLTQNTSLDTTDTLIEIKSKYKSGLDLYNDYINYMYQKGLSFE